MALSRWLKALLGAPLIDDSGDSDSDSGDSDSDSGGSNSGSGDSDSGSGSSDSGSGDVEGSSDLLLSSDSSGDGDDGNAPRFLRRRRPRPEPGDIPPITPPTPDDFRDIPHP